jgi:arylsulfatase A
MVIPRICALSLACVLLSTVAARAGNPIVLEGHTRPVIAMAITDDGKTLVTAAAREHLIVWGAGDGERKTVLGKEDPVGTAVAINPDGTTIALGCFDNRVLLIDPWANNQDDRIIAELPVDLPHVRSLAFSDDGKRLVAGGGAYAGPGEVVAWDGETGARRTRFHRNGWPVYDVAVSPADDRVAAVGGRFLKPGDVAILDANADDDEDTKNTDERQRELAGASEQLFCVAYSPDGSLLAAGARNARIPVWKIESGELVKTIGYCGGKVVAIAFTEDDKSLWSCSTGGVIQKWDVESGQCLFAHDGDDLPTPVALFSPDARFLFTPTMSGDVLKWDLDELLTKGPDPETEKQPCTDGERMVHQPNIVMLVANDLGWGDIQPNGQEKSRTPNIDRLAWNGMRMSRYYAGSPRELVSRCTLLTGRDSGHASIRLGNPGDTLKENDTTIAHVLKTVNYHTGVVGAWKLGAAATPGAPNRQGFDFFYGFHGTPPADADYPTEIWRNDKLEAVDENASGDNRHVCDLMAREISRFLAQSPEQHYFLYVPFPTELAASDPLGAEDYADTDWTVEQKAYARKVTGFDRFVGRVTRLINGSIYSKHTIIIVTSDNAPAAGGGPQTFFDSMGGLRGGQGDLYEGGIRMPMVIHWPDVIGRHSVARDSAAHFDWLPTLAEVAGARLSPSNIQGRSILPLLAEGAFPEIRNRMLYFETQGGDDQAGRYRDFKAVQLSGEPMEVYDLYGDRGEADDIAEEAPELVERFNKFFDEHPRR